MHQHLISSVTTVITTSHITILCNQPTNQNQPHQKNHTRTTPSLCTRPSKLSSNIKHTNQTSYTSQQPRTTPQHSPTQLHLRPTLPPYQTTPPIFYVERKSGSRMHHRSHGQPSTHIQHIHTLTRPHSQTRTTPIPTHHKQRQLHDTPKKLPIPNKSSNYPYTTSTPQPNPPYPHDPTR